MAKGIKFGERQLDCSQTRIMGILNVTPDSFSDGGSYADPAAAVTAARQMLADGADIIDIGGESTRPGAPEVTEATEIARVVPVIRQLRQEVPACVISIDTRKSHVAAAALDAGADIVNDVSGLAWDPELAAVTAHYGAGLVLMHMRGRPEDMQSPDFLVYDDVVKEVATFLACATARAMAAGVAAANIIWDPGLGFAKNLSGNLELLRRIDQLAAYGYPLLVGPSRKRFIGEMLHESEPQRRDWGTGGVTAYLAFHGVELVRVHNVAAMKQLLLLLQACRSDSGKERA
ncbi:MAG: dihydropteroate synthase [Victivallales bacterium]|nr:dihydropteroate synthase [Victivallales bacterium]